MKQAFRPGYRHVFALLADIVSVYFGLRTSHAVLENQALARQLQQERGAVRTLELQNSALREQLAYQETPSYVEQVARQQLGLMKPGDHVLHGQDTSLPAAAVPSAPVTPNAAASSGRPLVPPIRPNWERWVQLFADPAAPGAAH